MCCADICESDSHLAIGTANGVLILLDMQTLALLKTIRLFKKKAVMQLCFDPSGAVLTVIGKQSKKVFAVRVKKDDYAVEGNALISGFQRLPDWLIYVQWHNTGSIICLVRSLVFAISVPDKMNSQDGTLLVRKTDP